MNIYEKNLKKIKKLIQTLELYLKETKIKQEKLFKKFKSNIKDERDLIDFFYEKIDKNIYYPINLNIYIDIINEFVNEKLEKKLLLGEVTKFKNMYIMSNPILKLDDDLLKLDIIYYYKALELIDSNEVKIKENIKKCMKNSINNIISILEARKNSKIVKESSVLKSEYDNLKYIEKRNEYLNKKEKIKNNEQLDKLYIDYEDIFNKASNTYIKYVNTYAKELGFNSYFEYKYKNEELSNKILDNLNFFYNENKSEIENIKKLKEKEINKIQKKEKLEDIENKLLDFFMPFFEYNVLKEDIIILLRENTKKAQKCIMSQNKYILIINAEKSKEIEIEMDYNGILHEFSHALFLNKYIKTNKIIPSKIIQENFAIFSEILFFEKNKKIENKNIYAKRIYNLFIKPIDIILSTYNMEKGIEKVKRNNIDTYINYFIQPYIGFNHFIATILAINMYIEYNKYNENDKKKYLEKIIKNNKDSLKKYFEYLNIDIYNKNILIKAFKYFKDV